MIQAGVDLDDAKSQGGGNAEYGPEDGKHVDGMADRCQIASKRFSSTFLRVVSGSKTCPFIVM